MTTSEPTVGISSTFPGGHAGRPCRDPGLERRELVLRGLAGRAENPLAAADHRRRRQPLFNALVLDIHPYVQDQMFAEKEGIFGRRLVAGAFVFSAGLGLVATNCVNAFSYGYDKLRFIKPVFVGDTIYSIRTNLDKTPRYKEMGLIRASYEVFKGEGELVLYCEHLQTVKYKNPADFVGKTEK